MRRLLGVELTRLRLRRAVLLLLVAAFVIPLLIGLSAWWNTRPPSAEEQQRVDAQVATERQQPYVQKELRRCLAEPERYGVDPEADVSATCELNVLPQPEWFGYYQELDLVGERQQGSGLGVVVVVTLLLILAGTTFAGADWNSGSMSNQLLFEPRRIRVWTAKALAVTGLAAVIGVVVLSGYWLALYAVARSRDLRVADGVLLDCLQMGWRGAGVAAAAALGGYALTMLFRSTVATLGVLFAVSLAGGLLIAATGVADSGRWQPQNNFTAIVLNGTDYYAEVPEDCFVRNPPSGLDCDETRTLSAKSGSLYSGALLLIAGVPSLLLFRRRDVP